MKFIGQGFCKDVLTYPLQSASVCRSCSSVPDFVVSLPCPTSSFRRASVLASQQTTPAEKRDRHCDLSTIQLFSGTNRLRQLTCKGFTPSGIIRYLSMPRAHAGRTQKVYARCGFGVVIKFSFLNFVRPRGTKTRFESPSRHKLKRCQP